MSDYNIQHTTEWPLTTRYIIGIGLAVAFVALSMLVRPLWGPLVIAFLLNIILLPGVKLLHRRLKLKRGLAVNVVFFAVLLLLIGLSTAGGALAVSRISLIEVDLEQALDQFLSIILQPINIFGYTFAPPDVLSGFDLGDTFRQVLAVIPGGALDVLGSVSTNLLWAVVVFALTYYFLAEGPTVFSALVNAVNEDYRPEWRRLINEVVKVWNTFLWGQLLIFVIMFVPTVGSVYFVIWLYGQGWLPVPPLVLVIIVVVVYSLVQQIDNFFLRPYLFAETLKLHPMLILTGLITATLIGGALGLLIIVPLMGSIGVIGKYIGRKMRGEDPWPEPAEPFDEDEMEDFAAEGEGEQAPGSSDENASDDAGPSGGPAQAQ